MKKKKLIKKLIKEIQSLTIRNNNLKTLLEKEREKKKGFALCSTDDLLNFITKAE